MAETATPDPKEQSVLRQVTGCQWCGAEITRDVYDSGQFGAWYHGRTYRPRCDPAQVRIHQGAETPTTRVLAERADRRTT